jgi:hypothetical protein
MSAAEMVLVAALELLGLSANTVGPIRLVEHRPADVSPDAEAFVRRDPGTVYIITSTPLFRAALHAGRPDRDRTTFRLLASVIAHERWHLRHGSDERHAYFMQLTTLLMLGAAQDSFEYHRVTRSMLAVLARTSPAAAHRHGAANSGGPVTVQ